MRKLLYQAKEEVGLAFGPGCCCAARLQSLGASTECGKTFSFCVARRPRLAILMAVLLISFDTVFAKGREMSAGREENSIFHYPNKPREEQ